MKKDIVVPEMGEAIGKGVIVEWLKKNGDVVKEGDGLFEFETDKATVVVPALASGNLEILVPKDSEVSVGQTVATVDAPDSNETIPAVPQTASSDGKPLPKILSPDVKDPVPKKPVVTGTVSDKNAPVPESEIWTAKVPMPIPVSSASGSRPTTRVKMTTIRKKTAERLVLARQQSAHVTTYNEIDMSKVMDIRSHHQTEFEKEHGIKIGYMSFFVKACCKALAAHRELNAQIDKDDIVYNDFYDIGIAMALDRGLVVPVVRNADKRTFADIETVIADLAKRARNKLLVPDELAGGTFTITNGGVFGSLLSTPVPAHPQVAILGMHAIKNRPVVVDNEIVIRPMMYVALTYDHRIVDGKEAIEFLVKVKEFIEEPDSLLIEL